jgi:spore maturation protein SpmA
LLNIGEKAGIIRFLSRLLGPFFRRLFPGVPRDHPAVGHMVMNFSANMLGLDNAATPFALKAMDSLQTLNPEKDTATNAQIMFLVLHTSGLTLIPLSIFAYRAGMHSADPTSIFIPCILTTVSSTLISIVVMAFVQRLRFDWVLVIALLGLVLVITGLLLTVNHMSGAQRDRFSQISGNFILLAVVMGFIGMGLYKKVPLFDAFIEGAKEGWNVIVRILPYLVGMLVAVRVFRDSGALGYLEEGISWVVRQAGGNTDFVPALPVAIMRPFSASGSRGLMLDVMKAAGPDSFQGKLASIMQNSAETTFYIIALFFGSVGIKKVRYSVWVGLLADFLGVGCAITIAYIFFH